MHQPGEKEAAGISTTLPQPPGSDIEGGAGRLSDSKMWKEENGMKKWILITRACILIVSFLSFVLMISARGFYVFQETNYVVGISFLATLHMAMQFGIKGHEFRTKTKIISPKVAAWIDFFGDQFMSYMLFSSASVGATASISLRDQLYIFSNVELIVASVSMSFFAFLLLAPLTLFSGYRFIKTLLLNE